MYEKLLENLISYNQVDGNLRRTADKGLISKLYRKQMNALALKYFGVDSKGNYTDNKNDIAAYRCPYSGEIIKDLSTAHLEHILPVSNNGGTVLFNCIPVLDKVNLSKSAEPNLLAWWQKQDYFNYDRLERLIQYMLEAYTLAFKEPTEEEVYDYGNSLNEDDYIENDDLSIDLNDKKSNMNKTNIQQNISYYQIINDLINELSKNRDVLEYNSKLKELKEQNIFGNIDEIEKVINIVQSLFKEILGDESKKYLSYSMKIDMNKLLKSLKTNSYEKEIKERFIYIEKILRENNIPLENYFDNLQDIDDFNILYFDESEIDEQLKNKFIENVRYSCNIKIQILIEMIKRAKTPEELEELFKGGTTRKFTTYKKDSNGGYVEDKAYGEIGYFWNSNKDKIQPILDKMMEQEQYITLKDKIYEYYMNTNGGQKSDEGNLRRIDIFIEMIKRAKTPEKLEELFKNGSTRKFTTYKKDLNGEYVEDKAYGEIGYFWNSNKDKIQPILDEMMETDIILRDKIDEYYMNTRSGQNSAEGNQRRIDIFIEMIKRAKTPEELEELFKFGSTRKFTTYKKDSNGEYVEDKTYGEIGHFGSGKKDKIQPILDEMMETDIILRDKIDEYYMNTRSGQKSDEGNLRRIDIFIEMIKRAKTPEKLEELFKNGSTRKFTTYKKDSNGEYVEDKTYGEIGNFWNGNKDKIQPILDKMMEQEQYTTLKDKIYEYYMNTNGGQKSYEGNQRRIDIFIEMIKRAKTPEELEELFKYGSTRKFTTYKKDSNGEYVEDKTYGEIGHFWSDNKDKIQPILDEMMETDIILRDKIDEYYINTAGGQNSAEGNQRRIDIFIEMIKRAKTPEELEELFKARTTRSFTTYKKDSNGEYVEDKKYGEIGHFWSGNKDKIQPILDEMMETDIILRNKIDEYYMNTRSGQNTAEGNQRRIDIFIEMIKRAKTPEELEELFKTGTKRLFTIYKKDSNGEYVEDKTYGKIDKFWYCNKYKNIIPQLFYSEKYANSDYDIARQRIMDALNKKRKKNQPEFKTIDEYIDTLDKTKTEVKKLIELRDSLLSRKKQLIIENQELTEELNSSYRRAM